MKVKTSITLSGDLLEAMDARLSDFGTRSNFIEVAVRAYVAELLRKERELRDIAIINKHADRLNKEALDVFAFQVDL
jgi:metal-responsive CopG/Arc/MetJ family transcriptional regulator